jgi:SAM-dependent methyltransferase
MSEIPAVRSCPLCTFDNRSAAAHPASREPWRIKTCAGCGFIYLENAPTYEELEADSAWEKTLPEEKTRRRAAEPLLHAVNAPLKQFRIVVLHRDKMVALVNQFFPAGPILDVGCASGRKLVRLDERYILHGIELSRGLAEEARRLFAPRGGTVFHGTALDGFRQYEEAQFTGVIMRAFLEHEIRPREALNGAHRVLRRGGYVLIKVPNYASVNRRIRGRKWCGFRFPDHVNYFTFPTLKRLLCETGFSVARCNVFDRFPTSDNLWLVARREPAPPSNASLRR